jgi:hypothetical protein
VYTFVRACDKQASNPVEHAKARRGEPQHIERAINFGDRAAAVNAAGAP